MNLFRSHFQVILAFVVLTLPLLSLAEARNGDSETRFLDLYQTGRSYFGSDNPITWEDLMQAPVEGVAAGGVSAGAYLAAKRAKDRVWDKVLPTESAALRDAKEAHKPIEKEYRKVSGKYEELHLAYVRARDGWQETHTHVTPTLVPDGKGGTTVSTTITHSYTNHRPDPEQAERLKPRMYAERFKIKPQWDAWDASNQRIQVATDKLKTAQEAVLKGTRTAGMMELRELKSSLRTIAAFHGLGHTTAAYMAVEALLRFHLSAMESRHPGVMPLGKAMIYGGQKATDALSAAGEDASRSLPLPTLFSDPVR